MGRRGSWQFRQLEQERLKKREMNPLWRGVGVILVAIMGVAGYAFSGWFLGQNAANHWIYIPPQLVFPAVPAMLSFLGNGNMLRFAVSLVFVLTAFAVLNFVYALAFPIQPGKFDLPTPKRRPRKHR
ncbi:MAG: hypothetical protein ACRDHG_14900 [Anaerolineales bacterium]